MLRRHSEEVSGEEEEEGVELGEATCSRGCDQDVVVALHHGQGTQSLSAGHLKRYIFRDPYPSHCPNKLALLVPSGLKLLPASSSYARLGCWWP